ncbi:Uncharacterised protein [Klebsiella pneumoniae subsp. ozaenae]|uniref:Uncharacterized protein n=1 Tax=Klebsiella pneumoniae subsp. ozaenae TaxID=574 RepID=A0A378A8Z6_KLEPO|nr:hypothetical protein [Klebsiella pneumoniae]STU63691.1 Uncharacterised protein [Klebsiella pneumoniae subsp. ozaenae]STV00374.1 Uncharacterised protein [Klebsiella pneumoniae subsp. ozaenae]VFS29383.1 Uncharacterised protein [Serratia liquefaciens]
MNIETVTELIQSLESAGELSIREQKFLKLAKAYQQLAAENKRLTDVAQGGAFVMQKALMKYEFGVGMTMQAEDFIRDAREKHSATDRIFAETEARGVEKFAAKLRIPGDDEFFDALAKGVAIAADDFAKQLREGADK